MIEIRRFEKTDAHQCAAMIKKSLRVLNSKDYPREVIMFMERKTTPHEMLILNLNRDFIVADLNGKIIGTATLKDNYVGGVFVDPDYIGKGVGRKLMEEIERIAIKRGVKELEFGATITSIGFYMKLGYEMGKKIDTGNMGIVIKATKQLSDHTNKDNM